MSALPSLAPPPPLTMLVITDESGPLDSMVVPSWREHSLETMAQLVRVLFPALTVTGVEWAPNPRAYNGNGDDVLLVRIPGTHAVTVVKLRTYPKRKPAPIDHEPWDPSERDVHEARSYWSRSTRVSAPAVPKVERSTTRVVNTCPCCGTVHTEASWEALPLLSARDVREGDVVLHEVMRNCTCGSTRMVVTLRVAS